MESSRRRQQRKSGNRALDLLRGIPGEVFRLLSLALLVTLAFIGWFAWQMDQLNDRLVVHVRELEARTRRPVAHGAVGTPAPVRVTPLTVRAEAEADAQKYRRLSFREPVQYRWVERADLRAALARRLEASLPAGTWPDWERALGALGAVPDGTDVRAFCLEAGVPDPAAAYFPEDGRLFTASNFTPERPVDRLQLVLALLHALQDQNLMVTGALARAQGSHDRYWAWECLLEGDARQALNEAVAVAGAATPLMNTLRESERERAERLKGMPPFLLAWLTFPELAGPPFVAAVRERGGDAAVKQVFADPPVSSEQILHPERYLLFRDDPTPVGLATLEHPGWRAAGGDVMGEFGVRTLLETKLDKVTARLAAQGWDGDRYLVYLRETDGRTALVWRTIWDTEQDAFEFEDAVRAFGRARWRREPEVIVRGFYVTVLQSDDEEFLAAARAAWGGR